MSNYDRGEQAEWSLAVTKQMRDYVAKKQQALDDSASRGFIVPCGEIQSYLTQLGMDVKHALVEANGKIYTRALEEIAKRDEADQKLVLGFAKIDLQKAKAEWENKVILQQAEDKYTIAAKRADIEKLKSDIERRQAAVIEEEAKTRDEILYYKRLLINAERISLGAEIDLINQKVLTAQEKLKIIPYLYKVLDAERLVTQAEAERAASLQEVLVWEELLADVKGEMIPYIKDKAAAQVQLAEATRVEAGYKESLELLGYDKIALKNQKFLNDHEVNAVEILYEAAKMEHVRVESANEIAKSKARTALEEYRKYISEQAMALEHTLKKEERGYKIDLNWFWRNWELWHEILWFEFLNGLREDEMAEEISDLISLARDECRTIKAAAITYTENIASDWLYQYVSGE